MNWFRSFWKALATPMPRGGIELDAPLNNFTPRAQQALALARKEADRFNHSFVGTEHLLLGIIRLGQGTAVGVLGHLGLDLEAVRHEVEKAVGTGPDLRVLGRIPYTPRVKKVLALAAKEARSLNHTYVGTEHLLLGLLREGDGVAGRVLTNFGVDVEVARQHILRLLDPNFSAMEVTSPVTPEPEAPKAGPQAIDTTKRYDVRCAEGDRQVVYRNVLFKGRRNLLPSARPEVLSEFLEIEQADGQTVFVARISVVKFVEHGRAADEPSG